MQDYLTFVTISRYNFNIIIIITWIKQLQFIIIITMSTFVELHSFYSVYVCGLWK